MSNLTSHKAGETNDMEMLRSIVDQCGQDPVYRAECIERFREMGAKIRDSDTITIEHLLAAFQPLSPEISSPGSNDVIPQILVEISSQINSDVVAHPNTPVGDGDNMNIESVDISELCRCPMVSIECPSGHTGCETAHYRLKHKESCKSYKGSAVE